MSSTPRGTTTPHALQPARRPAGRPRGPEIDVDAIRALAALGLNATTIAARLGLSRRTLFERLETDPAARAAYDEGLADLVSLAAGKLRELIEAGNVTAAIFVAKTKGGFSTPRDNGQTAVPSAPVLDARVVYEGGDRQRALRAELAAEDGTED